MRELVVAGVDGVTSPQPMEKEVMVQGDRVRWWSAVRFRRFVVLVVGVTGLLALLSEPAQAIGIQMQHCEPLLRR
jgi:hypothetical protein